MVERPRPPIACGQVRVVFIARRALTHAPVENRNTPRGTVRISTPEVTALNLAGYPVRAGGLDIVATIVSELVERLEASKLAEAASLVPVPWAQRLGYVLELVGGEARRAALAGVVREYAPLATGAHRGEAFFPRDGLALKTRVVLRRRVIRMRGVGSAVPTREAR